LDLSYDITDNNNIITYNSIDKDGKYFFYNLKKYHVSVNGRINDKKTKRSSMGVLDFGRGVWPYQSYWRWATANGKIIIDNHEKLFSLNLGGGYLNPLSAKATEDALFIDNNIIKLNQSYQTIHDKFIDIQSK